MCTAVEGLGRMWPRVIVDLPLNRRQRRVGLWCALTHASTWLILREGSRHEARSGRSDMNLLIDMLQELVAPDSQLSPAVFYVDSEISGTVTRLPSEWRINTV